MNREDNKEKRKEDLVYRGFEQGPIRPPSEAGSLLLRLTRNCPWNHCRFCPVYKGQKFSLRSREDVIRDIDLVHKHLSRLLDYSSGAGLNQEIVKKATIGIDEAEMEAFYAAINWIANGMESIFLQDANSLIMKPDDLIFILAHIKKRFPRVKRITSYARSHTIKNIPEEKLKKMREEGLDRIHIGMESGSDKVLDMVKKGVDKEGHIIAGQKVKAAGMSLSEYVMPGLGGKELSSEHALETADALNKINPDFIRLRTLALPTHTELYEDFRAGLFNPCSGEEIAEETLSFIGALEGIDSVITSDHVLNLFESVAGKLPEDKPLMMAEIQSFLDMPERERMLYQLGRRMGLYRGLKDFSNPHSLKRVEEVVSRYDIRPDNLEMVLDDLMRRFI